MNEIFSGEQCKIARFFVMRPIFLLCVIMRHNIVDAPMSHYDKINIKRNEQLFFVVRPTHYDKLTITCNALGT